jgi:hypothetical protein
VVEVLSSFKGLWDQTPALNLYYMLGCGPSLSVSQFFHL